MYPIMQFARCSRDELIADDGDSLVNFRFLSRSDRTDTRKAMDHCSKRQLKPVRIELKEKETASLYESYI